MHVVTNHAFDKIVAKLSQKIKESLRERLEIFRLDPFAEILNNHKLHGQLKHYRSINITGDYRLVFEQYSDNVVRLIDAGTHSEIYGR